MLIQNDKIHGIYLKFCLSPKILLPNIWQFLDVILHFVRSFLKI